MSLSPLARTLESDLCKALRNHHLVIWLDKDHAYEAYVDRLVQRYQDQDFFAPVVAFRGSYLKMLLHLEALCADKLDLATAPLLLLHMPGHTEHTIRDTPILSLYRSGHRYRKALNTLIQEAISGQVAPDRLQDYLRSNPQTLEAAETWWTQQQSPPPLDNNPLQNLPIDTILDALLQGEQSDSSTPLLRGVSLPKLQDHLHYTLGLSEEFCNFYRDRSPLSFSSLVESCGAWLLCVEYVQDLKRPPTLAVLKPLKKLPQPLLKHCQQGINHLRNRYENFYANLAKSVENSLEAELAAMTADELGIIDTFLAEEIKILEAGLQALHQQQWSKALNWANSRLQANSFWLRREPSRVQQWQFIKAAATLGNCLSQAQNLLNPNMTLREALEAYCDRGAAVDRAHRCLEQKRATELSLTPSDFPSVFLPLGDMLRQLYHTWATTLADTFATLCDRNGFLPDPDLQQRTLYTDLVQPLIQRGETVVYFLLDAFRYEMATELRDSCQNSLNPRQTEILDLSARYAELPTITAVGMNLLVPLTQRGKVHLPEKGEFTGFRAGEYTVSRPKERVRAIQERGAQRQTGEIAGVKETTLKAICDATTEKLQKDCAKADLLIVHGPDIDQAGEANQGVLTFSHLLGQIKTAWDRLRNLDHPKFTTFIFTADHGFLLRDTLTTSELSPPLAEGCQRRYLLSRDPRQLPNTVSVSFNQLGYEGQTGYLHFARSIEAYRPRSGATAPSFMHGGNSLQERVIPVLLLAQKHPSRP